MEDAMTDEPREGSDRSRIAGLRPVKVQTEPYDATHDPRTGRPPNPLEAQHLARKHDRERLERENEDGCPPGRPPTRWTIPRQFQRAKAYRYGLAETG